LEAPVRLLLLLLALAAPAPGSAPAQKLVTLRNDGPQPIIEYVHFAPSSSRIPKEADVLLQEIAKVMKSVPTIVRVRVEGHAEPTEAGHSTKKQQVLSEQRANAVRDALIRLGVEPGRLTAVGYAAEHPIMTNLTPMGRERNRRVEFHVEEQPEPSP
jgi:outer membrane protein OmpA-like peptidoglycan-associated protein